MKLLIYCFIFASFPLFAQTKGIVKDESGKPIPYVSISVENQNIGTTSEENGTFSIQAGQGENLIFSALGFEDKIVKSAMIQEVVLIKKNYELEEIVIESRKRSKKTTIGNYSDKKIDLLLGNSGKENTHISAKFIPFDEKIRQHPFINTIEFSTFSYVQTAILRIRIFNVDKNAIPTNDVINEDILVYVKKGNRNNKVDLSQYQIKIPEEGIIIGFEYLKLEQNKYYPNFIDQTEEERKKNFSYEPKLRCYFGKNKLMILNKDGSIREDGNLTKNFEIALKIALTN